MKTALLIVGVLFLIGAALATPAAIVYGVYSWATQGVEFASALWIGVKLWVTMLGLGFVVGLPCCFAGVN